MGIIIKRLREGTLDQDWCKKTDSPELSQYKRERNSLVLQKGILYRQARPRESDETLLQLVLPTAYREVALKGCHNEVGHLGLERMLDLMHDRFFWPHMAAQAKEHIGKCCPCLAFKARQPKAPLKNIVATHPLELVHLDFLCLEPGKGQEENVLVITDHFTRYAQAYVTRTQMAQTMAKTLWDKFIVHYGLPKKILTDQGCNFESQLVADLCELMGVRKIQTSPYHPQTNGQCERFNSTLINMLGTLPKEKKSEWKNHIGTLVHAYNCTHNLATGFSPYYLMFGRQPCLPIDVTLGLAPCTITEPSTTKFVQKLREQNRWAHQKAEVFQVKEAERHKHSYNKKGKAVALEVGDMVLVCVTTFKGRHKMQNRWENREYVVEKWPYPDLPVYVVCPRDGEGHSQTLHRNYLLPISSNMGQDETDGVEDRVKSNTSLTQGPSVSGSTQNSPDQPAPVRCGIQTTRGQLPWRYRNFGLLTDTESTSIQDAQVDLHSCLHILVWLYNTFKQGAI